MSDELIKKNALISTLKNWLSEDMTAHSTMYGDGYDDAVQDIIKLIETEMPVNVVELPCKVRDTIYEPYYTQRAKWVNNEGCIPECSNCHYLTSYDYFIDDYEYGNYCPNCGAKMEGDGE